MSSLSKTKKMIRKDRYLHFIRVIKEKERERKKENIWLRVFSKTISTMASAESIYYMHTSYTHYLDVCIAIKYTKTRSSRDNVVYWSKRGRGDTLLLPGKGRRQPKYRDSSAKNGSNAKCIQQAPCYIHCDITLLFEMLIA